MMTFLRLGLFVTAITLSSCVVTTAPEPPDFKLSDEALSHKYPATRRAGTVRLYAQKIETTRDQWGRETHQATGGALLVKGSSPPILAEAPAISVTPQFSEALGRATVKKNDRLFIGQNDSATIRIDGTEIIPQGPVRVHKVAAENDPRPASPSQTTAAALPPAAPEAPEITPSAPARPKPKKVSKPQSQSRPKAASPATTKPAPLAKTAPPPAKPATPPPVAKPKEIPAADHKRLLNLMRDPSDR